MNTTHFEAGPPAIRTSPFSIYIDQAGYYPGSPKTAVIPFACDTFEVLDLKGTPVYQGVTVPLGDDETSGDTLWLADFSPLSKEGNYYVRAGQKTSALFRIDAHVYEDVFTKTSNAFYYLRCGCGLLEAHAGVWHHGPCHTGPALLWEDHKVSLDVTGGWHDAGDYGRYVTAGACAAAHLLYAYRLFPEVFDRQDLNIPSSDTPDILSEVRYELEWLLKMQDPDGGACHKATTAHHAPFVMPEEDLAQMYVLPVSSMATADLAAVCALASEIYAPYDRDFSEKLLAAAQKSLAWLMAHPDFIGFSNPPGCRTGGYGERDDHSNRFWAYAQMYALTGKQTWHDLMIESLKMDFPLTEFGYSELGGFGALAYLLCHQDKDPLLEDTFKQAFLQRGAALKEIADHSGYRIAMTDRDYYWGSNMGLMTKAMVFAVNDILLGDRASFDYACSHLHYLLGTNALGICYVTGVGEFRSNYPHLRPAAADGIEECLPGFVCGGPNRDLSDPFARQILTAGTAPMKCYADDVACYSLNEVTIYWNSPTVFILAYLCQHAG